MMYILLVLAVLVMMFDLFLSGKIAQRLIMLENEVKELKDECKRLDDNQCNLIDSVEVEFRHYFSELGVVFECDRPEPDPCENCQLGETNDCQLCPFYP